MEKWWKEPEVVYVPITKMVPQITYETVIEQEYIYKTVFVQLPAEVIYDTVIEYQTIYETIIEYVPEYVYEVITETEYVIIYDKIYEEVEKIVITPPSKEDIIQYIKDNPAEVINIIKENPNWKEILKEIIKEIPPGEIITYLTDDQIKYIISQQPPQLILQTITIINIEYIIFSGDASVYNGNSPTGGTNLNTQEKNSNDTSVSAMAKALVDHPDYLIMLHGHANPTSFTEGETLELMKLSEDRARAVETALRGKFMALNSGTGIDDDRVSVSGYGGDKNLFGSNSTYTGLNRRVEMILVRVGI
jgi:hypothetical protein